MGELTPFEQLGGESDLRVIIDQFVDRMFDDIMIGFFFARADRDRIKRFEYQHAAEFLGADVQYEGRALRTAHGPHAIRGGHFERRKTILRKVLQENGVDDDIVSAWMTYIESLRAQITADPGSECRDGER